MERDPRGIQKPTWEPPTPWVLELWPPEVSILMENLRDGRPISRDIWHFSNFDVFLKGEPRGIQKPKRDLLTSCGTRCMAVRSFNFIGKHEGGLIKICDFLILRFSDPLKGQNSPQEGPKVPKLTQQNTISAYYKALVYECLYRRR